MNELDRPPIAVAEGRLRAYAFVDESITYVNKKLLYVDGKLLDSVPRLAIYESLHKPEWMLFFCDDSWSSLGVTALSSLEEARRRAESEYGGISGKWIDVDVTIEEAERFLEDQGAAQSCSFCGRHPEEVQQMISSPTARICDQCVTEFFTECSN